MHVSFERRKSSKTKEGGDERAKQDYRGVVSGRGSLGLRELVHPSSEKGKLTERWGHKADGSKDKGRLGCRRENNKLRRM